MTPSRCIPFAGASNFRDLGGYPSIEGRTTRWGRLYRSDALHGLTEDDLKLLRTLGIATIIDLRSSVEVEFTGRGLLANEPIEFVNASIAHEQIGQGGPAASFDDDLLDHYLSYVQNGDFFVRVVDMMLDSKNYPMVVNCFFGKDRTGVLFALVLSCIGIVRGTIIDDYQLSHAQMPFIVERLRRDTVYSETIDQANPALLHADAATMSQFLRLLDEQFGGARAWAMDAGVLPQQLDLLGALLLD